MKIAYRGGQLSLPVLGCLECLGLLLSLEVAPLDDHLVADPSVELLAFPPWSSHPCRSWYKPAALCSKYSPTQVHNGAHMHHIEPISFTQR